MDIDLKFFGDRSRAFKAVLDIDLAILGYLLRFVGSCVFVFGIYDLGCLYIHLGLFSAFLLVFLDSASRLWDIHLALLDIVSGFFGY